MPFHCCWRSLEMSTSIPACLPTERDSLSLPVQKQIFVTVYEQIGCEGEGREMYLVIEVVVKVVSE